MPTSTTSFPLIIVKLCVFNIEQTSGIMPYNLRVNKYKMLKRLSKAEIEVLSSKRKLIVVLERCEEAERLIKMRIIIFLLNC